MASPGYIPPPNVGRRCSICLHQDVEEINTLFVMNRSAIPAMARGFAVSEDALQRHKKNCIPAVIERERSALISVEAEQSSGLSGIACIAKENRLRRLDAVLSATDEILRTQGLILKKTITIKDRTTTEEVYNRDLANNVIELHAAVRSELGETVANSRGGNQTVVFLPGSIPDLPASEARGLLADASRAVAAAVAGPEAAQDRVSLEGRKADRKPAADLPAINAASYDVETVAEELTPAEDTREQALSGEADGPEDAAR